MSRSSARFKLDSEGAKELRREAGSYLRSLRDAQGLTQQQAAVAVGKQVFTFISQIERGLARVPDEDWETLAKVYKVKPDVFGKRLLKYYSPAIFNCVFRQTPE